MKKERVYALTSNNHHEDEDRRDLELISGGGSPFKKGAWSTKPVMDGMVSPSDYSSGNMSPSSDDDGTSHSHRRKAKYSLPMCYAAGGGEDNSLKLKKLIEIFGFQYLDLWLH